VTTLWISVLVSLATGAVINELCDVAPWLADKTVRAAAEMWAGTDAELAQTYKEEWSRVINDAPGKLTKLLHAAYFYCGALERAARRRLGIRSIASSVANALVPSWRSTSSAVGTFAIFIGALNSAVFPFAAQSSAPSSLMPSLPFWLVGGSMILSFPLAGAACLSCFTYSRRLPRVRKRLAMAVGVVAMLSGGMVIGVFMVNVESDPASSVLLPLYLLWFTAGYLAVWNSSLIGLSPPNDGRRAPPTATDVSFLRHTSIYLVLLSLAIGVVGIIFHIDYLAIVAVCAACALPEQLGDPNLPRRRDNKCGELLDSSKTHAVFRLKS
jgi:hypothetical protein